MATDIAKKMSLIGWTKDLLFRCVASQPLEQSHHARTSFLPAFGRRLPTPKLAHNKTYSNND
jgi:hypothetical protein